MSVSPYLDSTTEYRTVVVDSYDELLSTVTNSPINSPILLLLIKKDSTHTKLRTKQKTVSVDIPWTIEFVK